MGKCIFEDVCDKSRCRLYSFECVKSKTSNEQSKARCSQCNKRYAWSQNDINMIDWLIRCCKKEYEELCNDKYGHQDIVSDLKSDCRKKWDWLEALKNRIAPQKQWKPSDEQMKVLWNVYQGGEEQAELATLYNDLKKLREE